MKTSSLQFEIMVQFMEQHGDISKPSSNTAGRMRSLQLWEELTTSLNNISEIGNTKATEKWKKVWADLKNNTKKKIARLNKHMEDTGGGPEILKKLSYVEQRLLKVMGIEVSSSSYSEEAKQLQQENLVVKRDYTQTPMSSWNEPGPSTQTTSKESYIPIVIEVKAEELDPEIHENLSCSTVSSPLRKDEVEDDIVTPTVAASPSQSEVYARCQPSPVGQTSSQQGRQRRNKQLPQRPVRPSRTGQTDQAFLRYFMEWRRFRSRQHSELMELRREQIRIREMELQVQKDWQQLASIGLELLKKAVDKYCDNK